MTKWFLLAIVAVVAIGIGSIAGKLDMNPTFPSNDLSYGLTANAIFSAKIALVAFAILVSLAYFQNLARVQFGGPDIFSQSHASFGLHIGVIIRDGSQEQMIWIDTARIIASVTDEQFFAETAKCNLVSQSVSKNDTISPVFLDVKNSVPGFIFSAGPGCTALVGWKADVFQESFVERSSSESRCTEFGTESARRDIFPVSWSLDQSRALFTAEVNRSRFRSRHDDPPTRVVASMAT